MIKDREGHLSTIGNIFWFVFGGAVMGLGWWLAGLLCFLSIIGIPWGRACFVIGGFAFFPFGRDAVDREDLTRRGDLGTGMLGFLGNVIWFVVVGVWLAIASCRLSSMKPSPPRATIT